MDVTGQNFILATGGTGGHIFPAIALAEELIRRGGVPVIVTDARFSRFMQDIKLVQSGQVTVHTITSARLGKSPSAIVKMPVALVRGITEAWKLFGELKPAAVTGFGGYPSFPTVVAAFLRGIPVFLHEQNAVMGKSNRVLSLLAKCVALSFRTTKSIPPFVRTSVTGNPVRTDIAALADLPYPDMAGNINILAVGGSLGASVFSRIIPPALAMLPPDIRRRIIITQQCRAEDIESVRAQYAKNGIRAECATFFSGMADLLARSHLVIARSGASTVAELIAAGRPAIFVPYPHATADHQADNAMIMVNAGGGWMIREHDFTPEKLTVLLDKLFSSTALPEAHLRLKQIARAGAAASLADIVTAQ